MAKRINYFATKNDMVLLLNELEKAISFKIKYILSYHTNVINNEILDYTSAESIPDLDKLCKNHSEKSFLIMKQSVTPVKKKTPKGVVVYQAENLESVGFDPGGFSDDGSCLIHGIFSVMEENAVSKEIFSAVRRLLNKRFTKVRGWYFGNEAKSLNGKVRYICIGTNEPEEYDFHI